MNKIKRFEELYKKLVGEDLNFLSENGVSKINAPALMLVFDNCKYNKHESILSFIKYVDKESESGKLIPPVSSFYTIWEKECFNHNNWELIRLGAEIYIENYIERPDFAKYEWPDLPQCQKKNTAFIDLVSGFNFSSYLGKLNKDTQYFLIDKSIMACEMLNFQKKNLNLDNVHILQKDVRNVTKQDIELDVEIIRAKNIFCYVPDFFNVLPCYKDMIISEGLFIFQEQASQIEQFAYVHNSLCPFFKDGWNHSISLNMGNANPKAFNTIFFQKHLPPA